MSARSLVASPSLGLPIAQMRSVFSADDVERKLAHLQASGNEREYDVLRNTWQRMLERGPQRFAVKPSGVPDMAPLYDLNRMNVFEIAPPSPEAARKIAGHLYRQIRDEHDWGQRFDPDPPADVLELLAGLAPREMRRALVTAFGNARLDNRYAIEADDLPRTGSGKGRIGFLQ